MMLCAPEIFSESIYLCGMMPPPTYLFQSQRLGCRNWREEDIAPLCALNTDPAVMEFFPRMPDAEQTSAFVANMQTQMAKLGYCFFAVDRLDLKEFIGFIGLSVPNFEADFLPCTEIGWRLKRNAWGQGFATEGAKRCLEYGFQTLGLPKIVAFAPAINLRSERVMVQIGMQKVLQFAHPLLVAARHLQQCVLYEALADA
jgi:RimJ/RimL family protein N-acetyltransferase